MKGIKIKGMDVFDNFEVNPEDSTISADDRNYEEYAKGKFFSNDSISLFISITAKVPNNIRCGMKKK